MHSLFPLVHVRVEGRGHLQCTGRCRERASVQEGIKARMQVCRSGGPRTTRRSGPSLTNANPNPQPQKGQPQEANYRKVMHACRAPLTLPTEYGSSAFLPGDMYPCAV